MEKNVGNVDAAIRILVAVFLIYLGLFVLDGLEGNLTGIIVTVVSIIPIYFAVTRKCILFKLFNISSIPKSKAE
jgi:hypothetical protein